MYYSIATGFCPQQFCSKTVNKKHLRIKSVFTIDLGMNDWSKLFHVGWSTGKWLVREKQFVLAPGKKVEEKYNSHTWNLKTMWLKADLKSYEIIKKLIWGEKGKTVVRALNGKLCCDLIKVLMGSFLPFGFTWQTLLWPDQSPNELNISVACLTLCCRLISTCLVIMEECHSAAVHLFGVYNLNEKPARVLVCSMQLKGEQMLFDCK